MGLFNSHIKFTTLRVFDTKETYVCDWPYFLFAFKYMGGGAVASHGQRAQPDSEVGLRVCEEEDLTSCTSQYNHSSPSKEEKLYHSTSYHIPFSRFGTFLSQILTLLSWFS